MNRRSFFKTLGGLIGAGFIGVTVTKQLPTFAEVYDRFKRWRYDPLEYQLRRAVAQSRRFTTTWPPGTLYGYPIVISPLVKVADGPAKWAAIIPGPPPAP